MHLILTHFTLSKRQARLSPLGISCTSPLSHVKEGKQRRLRAARRPVSRARRIGNHLRTPFGSANSPRRLLSREGSVLNPLCLGLHTRYSIAYLTARLNKETQDRLLCSSKDPRLACRQPWLSLIRGSGPILKTRPWTLTLIWRPPTCKTNNQIHCQKRTKHPEPLCSDKTMHAQSESSAALVRNRSSSSGPQVVAA